MLRLLIEDVTLVKSDVITAHVRLRGGMTRTLVLPRPVPIAQIRKTKPEVVAEVDRLLDHYCDREVAGYSESASPPHLERPTVQP
jgi:hypothetical protein